jgi:glycerol uptake operon antiterminator
MRDRGNLPLVNLDLQAGLPRSAVNTEFLAACRVAGIASTHSDILRAASKHGLITVQRTFALDSAAAAAGLRAGNKCLPDIVEILPAIAAGPGSQTLSEKPPMLRVVAGGLIAGPKEVACVLAAGIEAVPVNDGRFWI